MNENSKGGAVEGFMMLSDSDETGRAAVAMVGNVFVISLAEVER